MKRFFLLMAVVALVCQVFSQGVVRLEVDVPFVASENITLDGQMNEPEWEDGGFVDMITSTGFQIWANKYYREALLEPDYDEMYATLLATYDTLYVFMHIDEFVNDSTDLFWAGQWTGDQLFISLSSRLATDMMGWYDGNVYAAPEGPYHFLILGDQVTLNMNLEEQYVPEEYRCNVADSIASFNAADIARWATFIDKDTGVWNVEMAIYNPHVAPRSAIAFNIGGSTGSSAAQAKFGDAYGYFTWQPNVPDEPYSIPAANDPGYYNLVSSSHWGILNFTPPPDEEFARKVVEVPQVNPDAIVCDGVMDEPAWQNAAHADMITDIGFEIWANKYYRESLLEPDYDEMYGRMLWSSGVLYAFIHIDEFVNDSTDLYFGGQWAGDQLFVSLSSRLGTDMMGWYDGNIYAAPEGPYHFFIQGDQVTLNAGNESYIPEEYRCHFEDSTAVFSADSIATYGTFVDMGNGVWNVEMAISNPNVAEQARIGFNIGGSTGSSQAQAKYSDAYGYFTWQPNVPDEPYTIPAANDPGYYNLVSSATWAVLKFISTNAGVHKDDQASAAPDRFGLSQNYPNPFNPVTTIRFDMDRTAPVTLQVYNVLGELVATLISNKTLAPGSYSAAWDAVDAASGVYLYKLTAGTTVQTRKMMVLK